MKKESGDLVSMRGDKELNFRAISNGAGNNSKSPENLKAANVEVRSVDFEKDIPALTEIFNQQSITPHLSGFAPAIVPEGIDIERFQKKLMREHPNLGKLYKATEKGIKEYFEERRLSSILLVAEMDSEVVGTITIDLPAPGGMANGMVGKWAVSEDTRKKGIKGVGWKLLNVATANILGESKKGGLGLMATQAGIIQISGWDKPMRIFTETGYKPQGVFRDNCVSWDYGQGKFLFRDVMAVRLEVNDSRYKVDQSLLLNLSKKTA